MKELARRLNYFSVAFVSILGFSLAAELVQEDDFPDKIDDFLFLVLGIVAIWWYNRKGHAATSSIGSIIIVGLGLAIKIMAIAIEHADKEAVGDDIGVGIALVIAFIFVLWQNLRPAKQSS